MNFQNIKHLITIFILINIIININATFSKIRRKPIDIEKIRSNLKLLKQSVSDGITLSELRTLRDIVIGVGGEEAAELEKEIDELLSEPFDFQQELLSIEHKASEDVQKANNDGEKSLKNDSIKNSKVIDTNHDTKIESSEVSEENLSNSELFNLKTKTLNPEINENEFVFSNMNTDELNNTKHSRKSREAKENDTKQEGVSERFVANHSDEWQDKINNTEVEEEDEKNIKDDELNNSLRHTVQSTVEWGASIFRDSIEQIAKWGENTYEGLLQITSTRKKDIEINNVTDSKNDQVLIDSERQPDEIIDSYEEKIEGNFEENMKFDKDANSERNPRSINLSQSQVRMNTNSTEWKDNKVKNTDEGKTVMSNNRAEKNDVDKEEYMDQLNVTDKNTDELKTKNVTYEHSRKTDEVQNLDSLEKDKTQDTFTKVHNENFSNSEKDKFENYTDLYVENELKKIDMEVSEIKTEVGLQAVKAKESADQKADNIKNAVDWKADKVKSAVDWKVDKIKDVVDWQTDKVKDSIDWRADKVKDVSEWIGNKTKHLLQSNNEDIIIGNKAIESVKKEVKSKCTNVVELGAKKIAVADKIKDSISDKIRDSVELGTNTIKGTLINKYNDIVQSAADNLAVVGSLKDAAVDKVRNSIQHGTETVNGTVEFGKDKIKEFIEAGNNKFKGTVNLTAEKLAIVDKLKDTVIDKVRDSVKHGTEAVKGPLEFGKYKIKESVAVGGNKFYEKLATVDMLRDVAVENIKYSIKHGTENLKDLFDVGKDKIKESAAAGSDKFKNTVKLAAEKLALVDRLKDTTVDKISESVKHGTETVIGSVEFGKDKIKESAAVGSNKFKDAVKLAAETPAVVDRLKDAAVEKVSDLIKHETEPVIESVVFVKDKIKESYAIDSNNFKDTVKLTAEKLTVLDMLKDAAIDSLQDSIKNGTDKVKDIFQLKIDKVGDTINWKDGKFEHEVQKINKEFKLQGETNKTNPSQISKLQVHNLKRKENKTIYNEGQDNKDESESWLINKFSNKMGKRMNEEELKYENPIEKNEVNPSVQVLNNTENKKRKWDLKGILLNIWGDHENNTNENLKGKVKAGKTDIKENLKLGPEIHSGTTTTTMTVRQTSILKNSITIYHTETSAGDVKTLTLTSTVLVPSTINIKEVLTIVNPPNLSTKTVSVTNTTFLTIQTHLPKVEWKTKSITLSKTQIDVENQYETVRTNFPFYTTETAFEHRTALTTLTKTYLLASTMTVTNTKLKEIPVKVTQTKHQPFKKLVTQTTYKKEMVTHVSTIEKTETKTEKCKKDFFDHLKIKKFG